MPALIIFLVGLLIMAGDSLVPPPFRTATWSILLIAGIMMGAMGLFRL